MGKFKVGKNLASHLDQSGTSGFYAKPHIITIVAGVKNEIVNFAIANYLGRLGRA
jgi:hypothetical protein